MVPLEQGEVIIREVRRHWFFILSQVLVNLFGAIVPAIVIIGLRMFLPESVQAAEAANITLLFYPLWLLLIWIFFFYFWTDYYLDVLIVSNKRIIDIDQQGLFFREISSFPLENIQNITIDIPGFIATFLNFGSVTLQTASEQSGFVIEDASKPELVKQIIQDSHDKVLESLRHNNPII